MSQEIFDIVKGTCDSEGAALGMKCEGCMVAEKQVAKLFCKPLGLVRGHDEL